MFVHFARLTSAVPSPSYNDFFWTHAFFSGRPSINLVTNNKNVMH